MTAPNFTDITSIPAMREFLDNRKPVEYRGWTILPDPLRIATTDFDYRYWNDDLGVWRRAGSVEECKAAIDEYMAQLGESE